MNAEELIAFEADIAAEFNAGRIRAPVHLHGGNEQQLIDVFRDVGVDDWVCSSWRSHYHCLLKGVPPAELKAEIMAGRSIALCFPQHRIISSAIVGGVLPIAVGLAMGIKRKGDLYTRVWCFLGDMTAETGGAYECFKYGAVHDLPVCWIVENNGLSVCTSTKDVWGGSLELPPIGQVEQYRYTLPWPHSGAGVRVQF